MKQPLLVVPTLRLDRTRTLPPFMTESRSPISHFSCIQMCGFVRTPETGDLEAILHEFPANAKMPGNLKRRPTFEHKCSQCRIRYKCSRAGAVRSVFVCLPVVTGDCSTTSILTDYLQLGWLVT